MSVTPPGLESILLLRAKAGQDDQAFSRLMAMHQSKVRSFLLRLSHSPADADDLAQETFLIAYRKLGTFQASGEFGGWLCSIAYRCFLQSYRKRRREAEAVTQMVEDPGIESSGVEAGSYESITTDQIALEEAMQQIPEAQAAAVTLCESFGYSHSEAAAILGQPLGTVKSNVSRGKERLRRLLIESYAERVS